MSDVGDQPDATLEIEVASERGAIVVAVRGEIDAATVGELSDRVQELADRGEIRQVVDLSAVGFLDSSGLGALVGLRRRLEEAGGALSLVCGDNEIVLRLLRLTNLDTVLTVYPSVAQALGNGSSADDE